MHLGAKPDPASGQIMIVKEAPRLAMTTNERLTPWDDQWHTVRVERNIETGSIKVGNYADMIVLDRDITRIDPIEIKDIFDYSEQGLNNFISLAKVFENDQLEFVIGMSMIDSLIVKELPNKPIYFN